MAETELTKFEIARRQLVTAIRLFFEEGDSVSVYTLAHASWEVLDALCRHQRVMRFRDQMSGSTGLAEKEINKIASYGRNFFKHADKDPKATLPNFSDDMNDHVLIGASMDFGTLATQKPMEVQLFQLWYFAAHPEKVPPSHFEAISSAANQQFPGFTSKDRESKKRAGLQVLLAALRTPELMEHPSTDAKPVRSIK